MRISSFYNEGITKLYEGICGTLIQRNWPTWQISHMVQYDILHMSSKKWISSDSNIKNDIPIGICQWS